MFVLQGELKQRLVSRGVVFLDAPVQLPLRLADVDLVLRRVRLRFVDQLVVVHHPLALEWILQEIFQCFLASFLELGHLVLAPMLLVDLVPVQIVGVGDSQGGGEPALLVAAPQLAGRFAAQIKLHVPLLSMLLERFQRKDRKLFVNELPQRIGSLQIHQNKVLLAKRFPLLSGVLACEPFLQERRALSRAVLLLFVHDSAIQRDCELCLARQLQTVDVRRPTPQTRAVVELDVDRFEAFRPVVARHVELAWIEAGTPLSV